MSAVQSCNLTKFKFQGLFTDQGVRLLEITISHYLKIMESDPLIPVQKISHYHRLQVTSKNACALNDYQSKLRLAYIDDDWRGSVTESYRGSMLSGTL